MYAHKTRQGQANLNRTDKNTYVVNLPVNVAKSIYKKSRKRIALYLNADSKETMAAALCRLDKIQALLDAEDWQGLLDYEESLKPKVVQGIFARQSLKWLWDEYVKAKQDSWEVSYIENDVKQATRIINKCPKISLTDDGANELYNYMMETTTPQQTKRYLKQFSACITWAKRRRIVKDNPYPDLIKTISTRRKNEDERDINPFTKEERDLIIEAFRSGRLERYKGSHTKYADYIEFTFLTGARSSESLGLKWGHIDFENNKINFQEGRVLATNGSYGKGVQKKGLKTQKKRVFPMNPRLKKLLLNRKANLCPGSLEDNVFVDMNHSSFRGNQYTKVLKELEIDYRRPYCMRHTFITLMANETDLKLHQISQICGTSIDVIERHYLSKASCIENLPDV